MHNTCIGPLLVQSVPELNSDIPDLDKLLKHKKRLRKIWQETRDPMCKKEFNWISKTTRKRALVRWESKITKSEVTSQGIWPIVKLLTNRDGPRSPTAIHGHFLIKFHPLEKANAIADCLEKRFTPHDLCEEDHERQVEARVKNLTFHMCPSYITLRRTQLKSSLLPQVRYALLGNAINYSLHSKGLVLVLLLSFTLPYVHYFVLCGKNLTDSASIHRFVLCVGGHNITCSFRC
jgi:hypothetical protein